MLDKTLIILVDKIFNVYTENDTFRYHELVDILYSYLYEFISKKTSVTITDKQIYSKLDIIKCIDFMIDNNILLNIHDDYLIYIYKSNIYNPLVIINILNSPGDSEDSSPTRYINKHNLFRENNNHYKFKLNNINFYNRKDYVYRTPKIIEIAIENGYECKYHEIPEKFKTRELYEIFILQNPNLICDIPKNFRSERLYGIAINGGCDLFHIPDGYISQQMCIDSVTRNHNNIKYIPKRFISQDLWNIAFEKIYNLSL